MILNSLSTPVLFARPQRFRFGEFVLDGERFELTKIGSDGKGQAVGLSAATFATLRYFVENPGRIVTHRELISQLWPRAVVQSDVLKSRVKDLRAALGDDATSPRYLSTVRGRGYEFIVPVQSMPGASNRVPQGNTTRLFGRDNVKEKLARLFALCGSRRAQYVFITGEAGIGKSVLARDVVERAAADGAVVAVGHCQLGGENRESYYPIAAWIDELAHSGQISNFLAILTKVAPTWLIQLPHLMPHEIVDEVRLAVVGTTQHRVFRELFDLIDAITRHRPLMVLIEDFQWADDATLVLLEALVTRNGPRTFSMLMTVRTSDTDELSRSRVDVCKRLSLYGVASEEPLTRLAAADVHDYMTACAASVPPPERLSQLIHARTDGNPLFMSALVEHILKQHLVIVGASAWTLEVPIEVISSQVPPNLAITLDWQLERLPSEARQILQVASLVDGNFSPRVICVATNSDERETERICLALASKGHLIERSESLSLTTGESLEMFRFRHALFREAAYAQLGNAQIARIHHALANQFAEVFAADLASYAIDIGRHFLGALEWQEAVSYLRLAANAAMRRVDRRAAIAHLEQGLTLVKALPISYRDEVELGLLDELARIYSGSYHPNAIATFERVAALAELLGETEVYCHALIGMSYALSWSSRDNCSIKMERAIQVSSQIADPIAQARVRCIAHSWRIWVAGWNPADASGCAAALAILREAGTGRALLNAVMCYSFIYMSEGEYADAMRAVAENFDQLVAEDTGDRTNIALGLWMKRLGVPWAMAFMGQLAAATAMFDSGIRDCEADGDSYSSLTLEMYKGLCLLHLQDFDGLLDLCQDISRKANELKIVFLPIEGRILTILRGNAEAGLGRRERAQELFAAVREEMDKNPVILDWYWRLALEWGSVDAYLKDAKLVEAKAAAKMFVELAGLTREPTWRALSAESTARVCIALGDLEGASKALAAGWFDIKKGRKLPLAHWRMHFVQSAWLSLKGDSEEAESQLRKGEEALRENINFRDQNGIDRQFSRVRPFIPAR